MNRGRQIFGWIEDRLGVSAPVNELLNERLPGNVGWLQTLGTAALFMFSVQLISGIFLALYYVPSPDHAYQSLKFIEQEVLLGRIVRALHHWGSSLMVFVAFLHMVRVYFTRAYRKPRELTWIVGVFILLCVLGFAFTGYLLPWDQKAYWATVVGTEIAGTVPLLGPHIMRIMRGGEALGMASLPRFYAIHVIVLPLMMLGLIVTHLHLIRRHKVAGAGDEVPAEGGAASGKLRPYFPDHFAKETAVIFVFFLLLIGLSIFGHVAMDAPADPSDTEYIPRPEWYFLFLFELLKVFEGRFELVGSVILPTIGILALIAVPFLDRGQRAGSKILTLQRAAGVAVIAALVVLTLKGILTAPESPEGGELMAAADAQGTLQADQGPMGGSIQELSEDPVVLTATQLAGKGFYKEFDCARCHVVRGFDFVSERMGDPGWLHTHFADPDVSGTPLDVPSQATDSLPAFVKLLGELQDRPMEPSSTQLEHGARLTLKRKCLMCHTIHGEGSDKAPDLSDIGSKHPEEWFKPFLLDPQMYEPDSPMPSQKSLTPEELEDLIAYLLSLR